MNFDVSTDEAFNELEQRAAHDAWETVSDERRDKLAGIDLRQLARERADDFMQESAGNISVSGEAVGEQQSRQFGLKSIRNVYTHLVYEGLVWVVCDKIRNTSVLPAGRSAEPLPPLQPPQSRNRYTASASPNAMSNGRSHCPSERKAGCAPSPGR
jgi:hypothetical protein